ncbi:MAG: hypothetical protein IJ646_10385 [Clostridia bacterium]|nr:hypothetical protein [Clostridia bacterium]
MLLLVSLLLGTLCVPAYAKTVKATVSESSAKFYKKADTHSDYIRLSKGVTVTVSAVKSGWAKVKYSGVTGYMKTDDLEAASSSSKSSSSSSSSSSTSWKSKVVALKWFEDGKNVLKKGHYGYLLDIKSGKKIKIKRMGGHNHADIEPATKADAQKLKSFGASWDPRPAILKVDDKYVACSFNTMPHGDQTITDNDFEGQICLHMVGSMTHGGEQVRSDHQAAIKKAYNWAH